MIRRFGEAARADQNYKRRAGVYAVLLDGDALLTTFQDAPEPEYQLPGGGIDPGEQPIAALHREVMEETGWHISRPRFLGRYRRFTYMPEYGFWAEKLCSVYVARPVLRMGPPIETGHCAVWMSASEGLGLLGNDGDRAMLKRAIRRYFGPE